MLKYIGIFAFVLLFLFRPVFLNGKILFPSNLLMSSYAPWKYEPVPEYPQGPPNKPIGFDNIRQFYPNRKLLTESLTKGIFPLWNPYIYGGTPLMAAFDTAVWYPLSWIAALLPTVEGWNFLVIIQPILSFLFMYLFLKSLKLEPHIAAFGAFAWAFSGWMIVYWQEILVLSHSFLWLPLALYAVNKNKFFLLVFALVSSVFAGFLQMSIYVYLVVLAWNMYVVKSERVWKAIALSLCVSAVQLIPSVEAYLLSPRGTQDGQTIFRNFLLPLQHVITIVAPDFWGSPATYNYFGGQGFYFEKMIYIGIIPLVFALYGMFFGKKKQILFWSILAIVTLSLGFAWPASWLPYVLRIPVLSNSYPTRIFAVSAFSLVVLACYGLSSFLHAPARKRMAWILAGLTTVLVAGWIVVLSAWCIENHYPQTAIWCRGKTSVLWDIVGNMPGIRKEAVWYATVSMRNLIVPTLLLFFAWGMMFLSKKLLFVTVFVLTIASGFYVANKYLFFSERRFVYPELPVTTKLKEIAGYDRVWGYGNAFIEKNLPQYWHLYSSDGYGNLSPSRYGELLSTIINEGKLGAAVRRSDTDIYEASEWDPFDSNPYRLRLMSLLGVKYVLEAKRGELKDKISIEKRFPHSLFRLAWEDDAWRIWKYTSALPRAIFATNYLVKPNAQDVVNALYDPNIRLDMTVVLEEDPRIVVATAAAAHAEIVSYDLNTVRIRTESDADGFVVFTDNYYPGWSASVDGKNEKVYRADYTFKAVFVPKGTHTVIFQYMPPSLIIGTMISLIGIAVMFII